VRAFKAPEFFINNNTLGFHTGASRGTRGGWPPPPSLQRGGGAGTQAASSWQRRGVRAAPHPPPPSAHTHARPDAAASVLCCDFTCNLDASHPPTGVDKATGLPTFVMDLDAVRRLLTRLERHVSVDLSGALALIEAGEGWDALDGGVCGVCHGHISTPVRSRTSLCCNHPLPPA
jgi:hypothetical protein